MTRPLCCVSGATCVACSSRLQFKIPGPGVAQKYWHHPTTRTAPPMTWVRWVPTLGPTLALLWPSMGCIPLYETRGLQGTCTPRAHNSLIYTMPHIFEAPEFPAWVPWNCFQICTFLKIAMPLVHTLTWETVKMWPCDRDGDWWTELGSAGWTIYIYAYKFPYCTRQSCGRKRKRADHLSLHCCIQNSKKSLISKFQTRPSSLLFVKIE